jgi:hypothetical protein
VDFRRNTVIKRIAIATATGAAIIGLCVSLGLTPSASAHSTAAADRQRGVGLADAQTASPSAHVPPMLSAQQPRTCDVGIISRQEPRLIKTTEYGKVMWLIVRTPHQPPLIANIPCEHPHGG